MGRWLGSVLLIIGTSIGGAMLVLPVVLATGHIGQILLWLTIGWVATTLGALFILEVNLRCSEQANLISMAKHAMGSYGAWLIGLLYIGLLYTLLSAYTNGCSELMAQWLNQWYEHPFWMDVGLVSGVIVTVLFLGIGSVDWLNRGLLLLKLCIFCLLILVLSTKMDATLLRTMPKGNLASASLVVITAFGYAIIIPSLSVYLNRHIQQLKWAIYVGSFFPWLIYSLWCIMIASIIDATTLAALPEGHPLPDFIDLLQKQTSIPWLKNLIFSFSTLCLLTSFLGVALALFDFLKDGLQFTLQKINHSGILAALVFIPIFIIAAFAPNAFILGFHYAGYACVLLLIIMPAGMAYLLRHRDGIAIYQVWGGYGTLGLTFILGLWFLFSQFITRS